MPCVPKKDNVVFAPSAGRPRMGGSVGIAPSSGAAVAVGEFGPPIGIVTNTIAIAVTNAIAIAGAIAMGVTRNGLRFIPGD
ncbi:hypothetical protein TUM20985_46860 [Mycobacterium antarcticum]|nr:hypothetical protein TUM20985_46860 [Mycolicibacterium sp. TUM20985]GLP82255.1 hypothetical protein TUM20984_36750 [Mycolicibacterium sp. TUM20984]